MGNPAKTFRVRRLPAGVDKSTLAHFLDQSLPNLGGEHNIRIRSLASSLDDWSSPPSRVATLEFVNVPQGFQGQSETTWEFWTSGTDEPVIFDTNFIGFTPLNQVDERNHEFDCIAVSGLASHPFGSWRRRDVSNNPQFMWLRDQLPRDLPSLRCMTYGYDTKLIGSESFQGIDDLARSFVHHMKTIGRAEHSAKPLIIFGHSLGAIVVKRALVYLAGAGEVENFMLGKLRLFISFGAPNRGMQTAHLLALVGSQPNKDLIDTLSSDASNKPSFLSILDESVAGISIHRNIRLVSGYETERTKLAEQQTSGKAELSGPMAVLVSRESAIQSGSRNPQDVFQISQDHSNMVKFVRDDPGYFIVRDFIADGVKASTGQTGNFLRRGPADMQIAHQARYYGANRLAHHYPIVELDPAGSEQGNKDQDPKEGDHERYAHEDSFSIQMLLDTLRFEEQDFRLRAINKAQESTFGWIFEKQDLRFMQWIMEGSGVYWIRGKPGSGKSTLMRYLHDTQALQEALHVRQSDTQQLIIWFFFNERGSFLQKSLDGLLRGLLYNIVEQSQDLAMIVLALRRAKPPELRDQWFLEDLKLAFTAIMTQNKADVEMTIFLDALDEYYGFPKVISQWISGVITASKNPHAMTHMRFCFTSREWDSFVKAFGREPGFLLHEQTTADMKQYVISRLTQPDIPQAPSSGDPTQASLQLSPTSVVDMVVDRAEGVFLWVELAMDEIIRLQPTASLQDLQSLIQKLPPNLDKFYVRTIDRIPSHSRFRAYTLLEIVLRSTELLPLDDLFYAAACAHGNTLQECRQLLVTSRRQSGRQRPDEMKNGLLNLCGGLLECIKPEHDQVYVQFIHKTVRDFVASVDFPQIIFGNARNLQSDNGHTFMLKYKFVTVSEPGKAEFLRLAHADELLRLARADEMSTGRPFATFLNSVPTSYLYSPTTDSMGITLHDHLTSIFVFGVLANLRLFIQEWLESVRKQQTLAAEARVLNHLAWSVARRARPAYEEQDLRGMDLSDMSKYLLQQGFRVDQRYLGLTPFEILFCGLHATDPFLHNISEEMVNVARVFIILGDQDPNDQLHRSEKAFALLYPYAYRQMSKPQKVKRFQSYLALHLSYDVMTKMLLENGADPNVQDASGDTALDVSIGAERDPEMLYWKARSAEIYRTITALLDHGARFTQRGQKNLPRFLDAMRDAGYSFPDSLTKAEPLPMNVSTKDISRYMKPLPMRHMKYKVQDMVDKLFDRD